MKTPSTDFGAKCVLTPSCASPVRVGVIACKDAEADYPGFLRRMEFSGGTAAEVSKMLSSRIWLSICAFVMGGHAGLTLLSLGVIPTIEPQIFSMTVAATYGIAAHTSIVLWLYIFFRPRGRKVKVESRLALSVVAFLNGSVLVFALISLGLVAPLDSTSRSLTEFVLYFSFFLWPALLWVILITSNRSNRPKD